MGFTNEKDAVSPTLVDDAMRMYYMARTSEGFKNLPLELSNQEWCLTSQEIWDYTTNPQQVISHGSTERMDTYPPSDEWCFQPARHDSWLSWGPQSSTAWWLNKHPEQPVSWDHSRMANINPPTSGWIKTCGTTSLLVGFGDLLLSQNPIKKVAETSLSVEASPIQRRVVWIYRTIPTSAYNIFDKLTILLAQLICTIFSAAAATAPVHKHLQTLASHAGRSNVKPSDQRDCLDMGMGQN